MRRRVSKTKQNAGNKKKKQNKIKNDKNSISTERKISCTREVCMCAASFAADCVAICCCPCAILQLLVFAFVKVPSTFGRKALCYARKKTALRGSNRKQTTYNKDDHDDENERGRYSFSPLPYTDSPATTDAASPLPQKFDTQKLWMELYEAGYLGFGGPPFHWNDDDDDDQLEDACFHSSKVEYSLPRVSNG